MRHTVHKMANNNYCCKIYTSELIIVAKQLSRFDLCPGEKKTSFNDFI